MAGASHHFREEAINVQLAQALAKRGLQANAETLSPKGRPDVLILLDGIKLVLEGRTSVQRASLIRDTRKRVLEGLADIGIAVLYPREVATADSMAELAGKIEAMSFSGSILYVGRDGVTETAFEAASLSELVETINNVFHLLVSNDAVREQVGRLEGVIENVVGELSESSALFASSAVAERLKHALGIAGVEGESTDID